jgi:hypothetical protein
MIIYAVVSLSETDSLPERIYYSRTHADEVCATLNKHKPASHPGYVVEERETSEG